MSVNPYGQHPQAQSKPIFSLLFWLFWHGLALALIVVVLLVIVPRFDRMFAEFGLKLPVVTVLVIKASRVLESYGILLIPAGVLFHAGMLCLFILVDGMPRWIRSLWCYGVFVIAGGNLLIIVIGLIVPLLRLVDGLS